MGLNWLGRLRRWLARLRGAKRLFLVGVLPDTPADEDKPEEFIWEIEAHSADEAMVEAFARDEGYWDDMRIAHADGDLKPEDRINYLELAKCFCRIVEERPLDSGRKAD